jgi:hypothetical protein
MVGTKYNEMLRPWHVMLKVVLLCVSLLVCSCLLCFGYLECTIVLSNLSRNTRYDDSSFGLVRLLLYTKRKHIRGVQLLNVPQVIGCPDSKSP